MNDSGRRRRLGEDGASALEFGLVLPVLLLVLFSIIEYGWYMTQQMTLVNAVAAGARAGVKAREWDAEHPQDPEELAREALRDHFWLFDIPDQFITTDAEFYATNGGPRMLEVKVSGLEVGTLAGYLPEALLPRRMSARAVMAFP